ncbi:MAG: tyrosine-type recombinase/integrase [Planctomycetes bacterium]|nr:tyrosine-type recombinase/integrase [Planctomycetota bacterium]MBI3833693.1 tyrosine-type recombinase/integrase [Planctomycetota bacterium]
MKWLIEHAGINRLAEFNEDRIDKGLSALANMNLAPRTVNMYRTHVLSLAEWAIKVARIINRNPVESVHRRDESADIRKVRRSLSTDEAYRLLRVAGPRRLFYVVQIWTGLRLKETAALEWRDLDLDPQQPGIRLRAATTKAKRMDTIPLHSGLVPLLKAVKPSLRAPTDRVFSHTPSLRSFKGGYHGKGKKRRFTRGDLQRAGIPLADSQGRSIDRHALRTTFIS